MGLSFTKKQVERMIETLEGDYEDVGAAAKAVLATAEEVINDRSQFIVVGQVIATKERGEIPLSDPEAVKLALGPHATAGDAQRAAESLWSSTASGDTLRCWVLPYFHGSPHEWHGKQRDKYREAEAKRKGAQDDKIKASIEKRRQEMQAVADSMRGNEAA